MRNTAAETTTNTRLVLLLDDDDDLALLMPHTRPAEPALAAPPPVALPVAATAAPAGIPTFSTAHYADACLNRYCRFMPNSKQVTYAVLETFPDKPATMIQFPAPVFAPKPVPQTPTEPSPFEAYTIVPTILPFTHNAYAHPLPNGKLSLVSHCGDQLMRSRRPYPFTIQQGDEMPRAYTFHPGSPTKAGDFLLFNMPTTRFTDSQAAEQIIATKPPLKKTGRDLPLQKADILERDKIVSRNPDQNKTMGRSAVTEFSNVREKYLHILTPIMQRILKASAEADLHAHGMKGQERTEWLHGESYRHTPMAQNPQRTGNLGAARKCHNSEMMITEGIAKWFALNVACATVTSDFDFDMLLDTDVIDHIQFVVKMKLLGFTITITQKIDAFCQYPAFPKTSDMAGFIHILTLMIQNPSLLSSRPIDVLSRMPTISATPSPMLGARTTLFVSRKSERRDDAQVQAAHSP